MTIMNYAEILGERDKKDAAKTIREILEKKGCDMATLTGPYFGWTAGRTKTISYSAEIAGMPND